jgi:hypothetical protein
MIKIATLRAAGLSAEQIVKVLEKHEEERAAARREQNRIAQRNQRLRQQISADSADSADTPPSQVSPSDGFPKPLPITTPSSPPSSSSLRSESPGRARSARYTQKFEDQFWKPYPKTPVMSKKLAFEAFARLPDDDQDKAIAGVPAYKSYLASKPDMPAVHAVRFITQRRFDGFADAQAPPSSEHPVGWRPGLPTREEILERERKAREARANNRGSDRGSSGPAAEAVPPNGTGLPQRAVGHRQGSPPGDHSVVNGDAGSMDDLF